MANFYIPYKGLINKEFALQTIISWVIQQNLSPNFLSLSKFFLLIRVSINYQIMIFLEFFTQFIRICQRFTRGFSKHPQK